MSKKVKKKQATLFQLKGVLVVKDFNQAKNFLLSETSSDEDKIKALKHLLQKYKFLQKSIGQFFQISDFYENHVLLPGRSILEENKVLCNQIGEIAKEDPLSEVSKLANELRRVWKKHHKKLCKIKSEYELQREKGLEILCRRLPQIPVENRKIIDEIIDDQNDQKSSLYYKKRLQTILKKVVFRVDLHENLKNADNRDQIEDILTGL